MLTFEIDAETEKLDIHTDLEGLKYLRSVIDNLMSQSEQRGNEHVHLMTEEWGGAGSGLSSDKQHEDNELLNHIKIFCWHNASDS